MPRVLIENIKHRAFLEALRAFARSEPAQAELAFLLDKDNNEARYYKYLRAGAPRELKLPDRLRQSLAALAAQQKWSAMGPGLKEARKLIAARTNEGVLKAFMDSPAGRWPAFLLATGVDGPKARTMEALLKVYRSGRTPQDKHEAYAAMLKMTNKALLNPALRALGVEPPAPQLRPNGDPGKAMQLLGVKGPQATQLGRLITAYARAGSKSQRATLLGQMEVVARGAVKDEAIIAALKNSGLYRED